MSDESALLGLGVLFLLGDGMPLPTPFHLWNFDWIKRFEHVPVHVEAAAGDAINETLLHMKEEDKFALILNFHTNCVKTTATAFQVAINYSVAGKADLTRRMMLLYESLGTGRAHWPTSKGDKTSDALGSAPAFMWKNDRLIMTHGLTAAETIVHKGGYTIIEYYDPRYYKKPPKGG